MENDVVSENAITLTFCLKIRDYDDRAFLLIEEIGSVLWSNYPFYPVFLRLIVTFCFSINTKIGFIFQMAN